MNRNYFILAITCLYLLAVLGLSGCGSGGAMVRNEVLVEYSPEQKAQIAAAGNSEYRLRPGDKIGVGLLDYDELLQPELLVLPDGTVSFYGLDAINVAGMTVTELDSVLTTRYSENYRDVELNVMVLKIAPSMVYVLGEVLHPGAVEMPSTGVTVVGAITLAGGFTNLSARGSVVLVRLTEEGYLCREMNMGSFQEGAHFDVAFLDVQPYDIVYVSRSAIGDFAVFTTNVIGSLARYSQVGYDVIFMKNQGDIYGRSN